MFRFSIRDVLWLTVVVAVVISQAGCNPLRLVGPKRDHWEYAELSSKAFNRGGREATFTVKWEGPNGEHTANGFKEIGSKLGFTLSATHSTSLLNALGKEGWELVTHSRTEAAGIDSDDVMHWREAAWTLKRRQ